MKPWEITGAQSSLLIQFFQMSQLQLHSQLILFKEGQRLLVISMMFNQTNTWVQCKLFQHVLTRN